MNCIGLVSKHIVMTEFKSTHPRYPLPGIILITDELIEDIVILSSNFTFSSLQSLYPDRELLDFSDYYISPGIIDLNVRQEFESVSYLTKSALQGGVTVIALEPGYYVPSDTSNALYCDIAKVQVINDLTDFNSIQKNICALKAYLFPPSQSVNSVANLQHIINQAFLTKKPLFIDPSLPDPRMLYMASPLRLEPLLNRNEIDKAVGNNFAAAYSAKVNDSSDESQSESEETSEVEMPLRSSSLQAHEIKKLSFRVGYGSDEETDKKNSAKEMVIVEAKECEESTPLKPKKKAVTHNIYNDLDNRIKASQANIEDLCIVEKSTYSLSGSTSFVNLEIPRKSVSQVGSTWSESDSSEPNSASTVPKTPNKRELFRPKPIIIKAEVKPDALKDYKHHLANYPEHWELTGIEKVLEYLTAVSKVHFQNITSASAINRVRQARSRFKNITCEIPAVHLQFTSASIKSGDTRFKNTPPIRNQGNCNLLWDLLKMNGIDVVSSQHALIDRAQKITGNFQQALNGISSIGCALQSVWTMLNVPMSTNEQLEHYIIRLAKWFSLHPARILNLSETRGSISKGKLADLIIWNPKEKVRVNNSYAYIDTSPYAEYELLGSIKQVYLRGRLVFHHEAFPLGSEISADC